jgi:hypothetical protein
MKYVNVFNANGLLEAESIHLFLESVGIISFVTQESAGISFGLTFGPLGQAKVLVNEAQADEAKELLRKMEEGAFLNTEKLESADGSIDDVGNNEEDKEEC